MPVKASVVALAAPLLIAAGALAQPEEQFVIAGDSIVAPNGQIVEGRRRDQRVGLACADTKMELGIAQRLGPGVLDRENEGAVGLAAEPCGPGAVAGDAALGSDETGVGGGLGASRRRREAEDETQRDQVCRHHGAPTLGQHLDPPPASPCYR